MPRKKIEDQEPELVWNKKRLIIAAIVLILVIGSAIYVKQFVLSDKTKSSTTISVKGAQTELPQNNSFSLPTQQNVQDKISQLEAQVSNISVKDIATSSPQIQQILQQLQTLPQYPASQAKNMCIQLCNKL